MLPFGRFAKSEYFGIGLQPPQPLLATLFEFGFLRFETMARFDGVVDAIDKRSAGLPEQVPDGGGISIVPANDPGAGLGHDHASGSTRWALATRSRFARGAGGIDHNGGSAMGRPLPRPNAAVASGGGLQVYWISKTPLTPDQWHPLACALKNAAIDEWPALRCWLHG